jgi:hypothetical protein
MLSYLYQEGVKACSKEPLKVRLEEKIIGEIRKVDGGYQYWTKDGRHSGDIFESVTEVQQSLLDDNDNDFSM